VHRLGAGTVAANSPEVTSYFELLDRVLEDEIVTNAEAEGLLELAEMSGLSSATVRDVHRRYLEALAAAALRDAVVSKNERRELASVAALLGFEARAVDDALAAASKATPKPSLPIASNRRKLAGKTVCFTGELLCSREATLVSRQLAEELASEAGLRPVDRVTRQLDILVVADPHTMSAKACKARDYGTRIMAEQAFWRAIGIEVH
jgi:DNA polymerase-3 subunit epsilon